MGREDVATGETVSGDAVAPTLDVSADDLPRVGPGPLPVVEPGHYEILGEHGRGGLGRILRARDHRTGRVVAIKEALPDARGAEARFVREALVTANLQHPAIVPVYEVGRWRDGQPFYAMKLVAGRTLADAIAAAPTLDARLALLPHVAAVADALAYAHDAGVIHRDLKPGNVLVGEFGETVVIDWGLAKRTGEPDEALPEIETAETRSGAVMGTPAYMAPEQAAGAPVDARADVYALGAMLYHLLAGAPPFADARDGAEVLARVRAHARPAALAARVPDVPPELAAIVDKAMAPDAARRYPTAAELAGDLRRFTTGQLVGAHGYSALELARRWIRRHRGAVAVAAIATIVLVAVASVLLARVVSARRRAEAALVAEEASRADADHARDTAEARRREADARRVALDRELARIELDANRPGRALPYLAEALHAAPDDPIVRVLLGPTIAATSTLEGAFRVDGDIDELEASADGALLLVSGAAPETVVWDVAARRVRARVRGVGAALAAAGDRVAAASPDDGGFRVSDLDGGHAAAAAVPAPDVITQLAFVDHDRAVFAASRDGRLSWRDPRTLAVRGEVRTPAPPTMTAVSPDGRLVVAGGPGGEVWAWRTADGRPVAIPRRHAGAVSTIVFAGDGQTFATGANGVDGGGGDRVVRVWSARGELRRELALPSAVVSIALSDDGRRVAVTATGLRAQVWDVATGEVLARLDVSDDTQVVALSGDGARVATFGLDGAVVIWDVATSRPLGVLGGLGGGLETVRFTPDGARVAAGTMAGDVRVWRVPGPAERALPGADRAVWPVYLGDGARIAVGGADRRVRVVDATTAQVIATLAPTARRITDVAPSRDGRRLAIATDDDTVALVGVDGAAGPTLRGLAGVHEIAWRADGAELATGGEDGLVRRWRSDDGRELARFAVGAPVQQVRWLGADRLLVVTAAGASVRDAARGTELHHVALDAPTFALAISPDGDHAAFSDVVSSAATVLDVRDGAVTRVRGSAPLLGLAWMPDGALVTAAVDGDVALWNADGTRRLGYRVPAAEVTSVDARADGRLLVLGTNDAVVVVDTASGRVLRRVPLAGMAFRVFLRPDGAQLAVASDDGGGGVIDLAPWTGTPAALDAAMACGGGWRLDGDVLVPTTPATTGCAP